MINRIHKTFKFWQNFSTRTILKIRFFSLPDINQGIHKQAIQNKLEFYALLKKLRGKKEKSKISIFRTTLCKQKTKFYASKKLNVCSSTKFVLRLKKPKNNSVAISEFLEKFFDIAIKKVLVIQFLYMETV